MKSSITPKKSNRNSFKTKIKSAKSISDLKKNQILLYYSTFPLVNIQFLSELTGISVKEIERIINIPHKTKKKRINLTKEDSILLRLICKGLTSKEIGEVVGRSYRSVEASREFIMKKFGVKRVAELITYSLKNNIVN